MTDIKPIAARPGRLTQLVFDLFMKHATVAGTEIVAPAFHLVTLESPQFKTVVWTPGQKLQIGIGHSFTNRTYTPIEWDRAAGRTRFLAYIHGSGPGSDWVRDLTPGDDCEVFGPRSSLDLGNLPRPTVLFGDETSFGVAIAVARKAAGPMRYLFEVNAPGIADEVLRRFGVANAELFQRLPNDAHMPPIAKPLIAAAAAGSTFVLTGKASSIQRLRQALKALDVPSSRIMTKAYWAPGKKGLD